MDDQQQQEEPKEKLEPIKQIEPDLDDAQQDADILRELNESILKSKVEKEQLAQTMGQLERDNVASNIVDEVIEEHELIPNKTLVQGRLAINRTHTLQNFDRVLLNDNLDLEVPEPIDEEPDPKPKSSQKDWIADMTSEDRRLLDEGGDDEEVMYKIVTVEGNRLISHTGSDLQLPAISEDGDATMEMVHLIQKRQEEAEQKKRARQPVPPVMVDMQVQTDPPEEEQVVEYQSSVAAEPIEYNTSSHQTYEYEARSSVVAREVLAQLMAQVKDSIQDTNSSYQGLRELDLEDQSQQADLIDNLKTSLRELEEAESQLQTESIKKKNFKLQANLEGKTLAEVEKELKQKNKKLKKLAAQKQELLEQIENETKKEEQKKQRDAKLKKQKLKESAQKLLDYKEKLKDQEKSQRKQVKKINKHIDKLSKDAKEMSQQFLSKSDNENSDSMPKVPEDDNEHYASDEAPNRKSKQRKGKEKRKLTTNNTQTEGDLYKLVGDHPKEVVDQIDVPFIAKPFEKMKSSIPSDSEEPSDDDEPEPKPNVNSQAKSKKKPAPSPKKGRGNMLVGKNQEFGEEDKANPATKPKAKKGKGNLLVKDQEQPAFDEAEGQKPQKSPKKSPKKGKGNMLAKDHEHVLAAVGSSHYSFHDSEEESPPKKKKGKKQKSPEEEVKKPKRRRDDDSDQEDEDPDPPKKEKRGGSKREPSKTKEKPAAKKEKAKSTSKPRKKAAKAGSIENYSDRNSESEVEVLPDDLFMSKRKGRGMMTEHNSISSDEEEQRHYPRSRNKSKLMKYQSSTQKKQQRIPLESTPERIPQKSEQHRYTKSRTLRPKNNRRSEQSSKHQRSDSPTVGRGKKKPTLDQILGVTDSTGPTTYEATQLGSNRHGDDAVERYHRTKILMDESRRSPSNISPSQMGNPSIELTRIASFRNSLQPSIDPGNEAAIHHLDYYEGAPPEVGAATISSAVSRANQPYRNSELFIGLNRTIEEAESQESPDTSQAARTSLNNYERVDLINNNKFGSNMETPKSSRQIDEAPVNPDNLPDHLNLGFGDSASQRQNDPALKGNAFISNLESAKNLAHSTREKMDKLSEDQMNERLLQLVNQLPESEGASILEYQDKFVKQLQANQFLKETLKLLSSTTGILIDQYDPVKINKKFISNQERHREDKAKFEQGMISRKLDEIKNAKKALKNNQKELASLIKKHDKVNDHKYLAKLYKQVEDDKKSIRKLEKENVKLEWEQRRAELKLNKKINQPNLTDRLLNSEITHTELLKLDNEIKLLEHKNTYLDEKLDKEERIQEDQLAKIDLLRRQLRSARQKEQDIIEHGRTVYKIDFEDFTKQFKQEQQETLVEQKDKLLKKMVIIEDSKASIDKQYARQHRANEKQMAYMMEMKREMEEQLRMQEQVIAEKQRQHQFYKEQKAARDTIMKSRHLASQRESQQTTKGDSKSLGQFMGLHHPTPKSMIGDDPSSRLFSNPKQSTHVQMSTRLGEEDGEVVIEEKQGNSESTKAMNKNGLSSDQQERTEGDSVGDKINMVESVDNASQPEAQGSEAIPITGAILLSDGTVPQQMAPQIPVVSHAQMGEHLQESKQSVEEALNKSKQASEQYELSRGAPKEDPARALAADIAQEKRPVELTPQQHPAKLPRNMEDIAIIRETLAELDDEDLTGIDLERHNFQSSQKHPIEGADRADPSSHSQINFEAARGEQQIGALDARRGSVKNTTTRNSNLQSETSLERAAGGGKRADVNQTAEHNDTSSLVNFSAYGNSNLAPGQKE